MEEEEDPFEKIDIMQDDPDPFDVADVKVTVDSERKASSSESRSDSDSESDSESESDSGSQSKSKSPAGSASGSSSDSDSDGSSSSKEGSDVDVDIMTSEGEKEGVVSRADAADLNLSSSPGIRTLDGEQEQIDIMGDMEELITSLPIALNDHGRDNTVAISAEGSKEFLSDNTVKTSEKTETKCSDIVSNSYRADSRFSEVPYSPDQYKRSEDLELQFGKLPSETNEQAMKKTASEKQPILDDSTHEKIETSKKTKTKRASGAAGSDYSKEKPESAKRSKGAGESEVMPEKSKDGAFLVKSSYISPKRSGQDKFKTNDVEWSGNKYIESQDCNMADSSRPIKFGNAQKLQQSPEFWSSSSVDAEQPGTRNSSISGRQKSTDRFHKHTEIMPVHTDGISKDKLYKDAQGERRAGEKLISLPEYDGKSGDHLGKFQDYGASSQSRKSDSNKSPVISGRGPVLRRELSELEMGELREPSAGSEPVWPQRQPEGKNSNKSTENKAASNDSSNLDTSKGKNGSHLLHESKKYSPQHLKGEVHGNKEGFRRKMPPDDPVDNATLLQRTVPSKGQQPLRADNSQEVKTHLDNSALSGETGANQGIGPENHALSVRKNPTSLPLQHDIKQASQKGYKNVEEPKQQKLNTREDSTDRSNNSVSMESETNGRKKRESSMEDDNSFYAKYDKEVPDFRESIKDFMQ